MVEPQDGKMGLPMTTAFVVGSIIGASVFMLPVALAPLGINAVVGWVVSGFGAICLGLPLARLARGGAGIQAAIAETFGSTVAFMITWAFWVSNWSGTAAVAVGAAATISRLFPALSSPMSVALVASACIVIMAAINTRGARSSGAMAIVTVLLRILPLAAVLILVGIKVRTHQGLQPLWTQPVTISAVATATALTLFAFTGFENVSTPIGKIRDSKRIIPQSMVIGLLAVALLYLTSSTSVMLLMPADQLARSPSPFADVVGASWGEAAALLTAVGIAISAFGCVGCNAMAGGELSYSMALKGDLPPRLAWTNSRGAPVFSQIITVGLSVILVLANASRSTAGLFTFIVLVSTVAVLVLYVVAALGAAVEDRSPGMRALVVAGILFSAYAFYGSGLEASLWGLGLALAGLPVRAISRWLGGSSRVVAAIPVAPPESSV